MVRDPHDNTEGDFMTMKRKGLVLLDGARTPMAEFGGSFSKVSAIELGAHAARAALVRSNVEPGDIDQVFVGNALQTSPDAIYGARHVALKAEIPIDRPALTVNRLCGSGVQSIVSGAHAILAGDARICLVGGMENMTQAPHCIWGAREGFINITPIKWGFSSGYLHHWCSKLEC